MANEAKPLEGKKVAILLTDGFEQVEMTGPRKALDEAGAKTSLVSPKKDQVQGWKHHDKADTFEVDVPLEQAKVDDFDALLLPGGALNPDQLRMNPKAVDLVRAFARAGKPIAAICHGPWTLVEAGVVKGKRVTSWPSIKTDLVNAGASWSDQEVVVEEGLVTSRKPDDIPAFNREMTRLFQQGARPAPSAEKQEQKPQLRALNGGAETRR
ncbi:MAG TPA: type 1 glutamine amidotransferase domain-containing protein [Polyangiaceae bacterium]